MPTDINPYDVPADVSKTATRQSENSQALLKFFVFGFLFCALLISAFVVIMAIAAVAWPISFV